MTEEETIEAFVAECKKRGVKAGPCNFHNGTIVAEVANTDFEFEIGEDGELELLQTAGIRGLSPRRAAGLVDALKPYCDWETKR